MIRKDVKVGDQFKYVGIRPLEWPYSSSPIFILNPGDIITVFALEASNYVRFKAPGAMAEDGCLRTTITQNFERVGADGPHPCTCPSANFRWNGLGCQCGGT